MLYKKKDTSFFENAIEKEKDEIADLKEKGTKKILKWYDFGSLSLRSEIKRRPAQYFFLFISTFLGSVVTSTFALLGVGGNLLATFAPHPAPKVSAVQEVRVSQKSMKYDPLLLASKLKKNDTDIEVIDIRSAADYQKGHITTAINVPVYESKMVTKSGDLDVDAVKAAFSNYIGTTKVMVIYAQNSYSTLTNDVAAVVANGDKEAKALAVGWEEWRILHVK